MKRAKKEMSELNQFEKRLLKEVVEAWESEGCFTTDPGIWGREDPLGSNSDTTPTEKDVRRGRSR